jgi:translation initiation factor 3 subunit A
VTLAPPSNSLSPHPAPLSIHPLKMEEFNQIYTEITTKKLRTYSAAVEEAMLKFVALGPQTLRYRQVKELLVAYKVVCQNTQLASIQRVFEAAIKAAKAKLDSLECKQVLMKMEDLDVPFSDCCPEVEYMRYGWEILKSMLDVLKNNNKFEDLFLTVAQAVFQFCIDFDRKAEFKRLGDFLRSSLNTMIKSSASVASGSNKSYFAINLVEIQSSTVQLEVRMLQLAASVQLKCWTEAYRILDDLQSLFNVAKKCLSAECLLRYFLHVSTLLSIAPDATYQLLACASLLKALGIVVGNGLWQQSKQQVAELCHKILLSFLCIPIFLPSAKMEEDERIQKILSFLGVSFLPTKDQLKREIVEIRGSFISQFAPNSALLEYVAGKKKIDAQLISLVPLESQSFIQANISSLRAIELFNKNSTGVTLSLAELHTQFPEYSHSSLALEKFIINCCINLFNVQPLIDQESGEITIIKDLNLFLFSNPLMEPVSSEDSLMLMPLLEEFKEERLEKLSRCKRIEERKEKKEQLEAQREQEAYRQLTERLAMEQEMEKARLLEESRKREVERLKREKEAIEKDELNKLIDEFLSKSKEAGKKFALKLADCPSKKDFLHKQMQFLQQDKKELENKNSQIAKRLEYTDRAIRKKSESILAARQATYLKERDENAKVIAQNRFEKASAKFTHDLQQKERITPFLDVFSEFKARVIEKHRAEEAEREALLQEQEQKRQEEMRLNLLADRPLHMQQQEAISIANIPKPFANRKAETAVETAESEVPAGKIEYQPIVSPFAGRTESQQIVSPFASKTEAKAIPTSFAGKTESQPITSPFAARNQSQPIPRPFASNASPSTQPISSPFAQRSKFQPDDKMNSIFASRMAGATGVSNDATTIPTTTQTQEQQQQPIPNSTSQPPKPSAYKFVPKNQFGSFSANNTVPTPFKRQ